ncbi:MAG: hydroxyectoine utilization dehydratase EutB [Anaerolineales bacterium]
MIPIEWLDEAAQRIAPHITHTPLFYDGEHDFFIKWESYQVTGSFKARGALNKVLALQDWERDMGLVTASAGNHGQGVALAGELTGCKVTVFVPHDATPRKIDAMRTRGAVVHLVEGGYAQAESAGRAFADQHAATWVSAYNDGLVIAGQGTVGLETLAELPPLANSSWVVPTGGGGLLSGIGAGLTARAPGSRLVGVQPQNSPFFYELWHGRSQAHIRETPTLAEGLAGAIEETALTIPLARQLAHDMVLVTEAELAAAVRFAWQRYGEPIEPSGAAGLAAVLSGKVLQRPAVVVVTGGNIQPELHAQLVK